MASRYVGQLGRYVGQFSKQLTHIQTCESAMWASQVVIHTCPRSLCVLPYRYLPSGARSSPLQIFLKPWLERGAP